MSTFRIEGSPIILSPSVDRRLLVVRGRSGLLVEDFDKGVVDNQRRFGKDTNDYLAMVKTHQNSTHYTDSVLGIHEETRRRLLIVLGEDEVEFVEANPFARNIWVGEHVKLYIPEEAVKYPHSGRNALQWATAGGQTPEMVVRANNGYFYPATRNDIVITGKTDLDLHPVR